MRIDLYFVWNMFMCTVTTIIRERNVGNMSDNSSNWRVVS